MASKGDFCSPFSFHFETHWSTRFKIQSVLEWTVLFPKLIPKLRIVFAWGLKMVGLFSFCVLFKKGNMKNCVLCVVGWCISNFQIFKVQWNGCFISTNVFLVIHHQSFFFQSQRRSKITYTQCSMPLSATQLIHFVCFHLISEFVYIVNKSKYGKLKICLWPLNTFFQFFYTESKAMEPLWPIKWNEVTCHHQQRFILFFCMCFSSSVQRTK